MKYIVDNDLHIHSQLSLCSSDPEQTNERILEYAEENGLKTICLTNHLKCCHGNRNYFKNNV